MQLTLLTERCFYFDRVDLAWTLNLVLEQTSINLYLTNGFCHHYRLGQSTFIIKDIRSDFEFLSNFSMNFR